MITVQEPGIPGSKPWIAVPRQWIWFVLYMFNQQKYIRNKYIENKWRGGTGRKEFGEADDTAVDIGTETSDGGTGTSDRCA